MSRWRPNDAESTSSQEGRSVRAGPVRKEEMPMSTHNQVEIVDGGDVVLVHLLDQMLANRCDIARAVQGWLSVVAAEHCHSLVLDCSGMERLSSEVLSGLVVLDRRLKHRKATMALCGVSPSIRTAFRMTRLNRLFKIRDVQPYRSMA